jgi:glycosyltransferase involved in cell wall biosynthesis
MMKLSIFIPVYNEQATILPLLDKVRAVDLSALGLTKEVLVVDDGSTDETPARLRAYREAVGDEAVRVIELSANHGKGYAVQRALQEATGELCVVQDADLEYDPADWPALLAPLVNGDAPVVYGSRRLPLGADRHRRRLYQIGLTVVDGVIGVLYRRRFTDVATCYKAMRTDVLRDLEIECRRFAFDMEVSCKILNRNIPFAERPISYQPRFKAQGKKIRWRDFFTSLAAVFYYRLFDRGQRKPKITPPNEERR